MIAMRGVAFSYAHGSESGGVSGIDLAVSPGEIVLVTGPSGCGKTTVARLANGLVPNYYEGEVSGTVEVCGVDVSHAELYDTSRLVGSVFQNPKSQFFTMETDSELAFGCENQGVPARAIAQAVDRAVETFGIGRLRGRSVSDLSGGEKQRLACAAVSVPDPPAMVLDEPSSNLDAGAIAGLRGVLSSWKAQGKAVLVAEHRLGYLSGLVDRVYVMREGCIERILGGDEFRSLGASQIRSMGLRPLALPEASDLDFPERGPARTDLVEIERLRLRRGRGRSSRLVLDLEGVAVPCGSTVAVIGRNGAGKTTFARCLVGLERGSEGTVAIGGEPLGRRGRLASCYLVMQDVNHQLFTESVLDEVLLSMPEEDEGEAMRVLAGLDLGPLSDEHPMSLSGGQKQRVAVASAVASGRDVVVFDEPTSGLDLGHMEEVAGCMAALKDLGRTQFVATHDPEFILACCDRVLRIEEGRAEELYPLDREGAERMLSFFRTFEA